MLLDCGPGVVGALQRHANLAALDGVLITHMHTDHCYDLLPLGKALLGPGLPAGRPHGRGPSDLRVPAGAADALRALNLLFPVGHPDAALDRVFDEAFRTAEYAPGDRFVVGNCSVTAVPVRHAVPTCGFRIRTPHATVAYTGDTGHTPSLLGLAEGADLLICEATLAEPDTTGHGHLSAEEAGRLAAEAGARHLLLTHFPDNEDRAIERLRRAAASRFRGPISIALPDLTIAVPNPSDEDPS